MVGFVFYLMSSENTIDQVVVQIDTRPQQREAKKMGDRIDSTVQGTGITQQLQKYVISALVCDLISCHFKLEHKYKVK